VLLALLPLLALHVQTPPLFPDPKVVITETAPRLVLRTTLHETCGKGVFDACTKFVGYGLRLNCSATGEVWNINGWAEFTPMILLFNPGRLAHERRHIEDVKRSAERYLYDLQSENYNSFGQCEEAAFNERLVFKKRLYDFAQESARRRDR
jgi:hypothetical protein